VADAWGKVSWFVIMALRAAAGQYVKLCARLAFGWLARLPRCSGSAALTSRRGK